ncbi:MAG: methane monooxygenase/ammonia monooxygenase subunit C [Nitrospira sp.]
MAPSDHPGHELHGEPHCGVLRTFPLYITCGVSSYLYAQTRLPLYSQATSFPLVAAVVGPMFILPNVGLNEWGHAFWFVDELFAAPLHWGFVTLGWCGLFGAAGVWRRRS